MARKTRIILTDDLDGSPAGSTLEFALDGVSYEIDLNDEHAQQLRESLAPWVERGRRVGGRARRGTAKGRSEETKRVREWAQSNGYDVGDRGRVPSSVREAYAASSKA